MLSDFFRINFPYGLMKNENGEWTAFNRDYLPLGYNKKPDTFLPEEEYLNLFQFTKYPRMTDSFLVKVALSPDKVKLDESGKICRIWFYDDSTNPVSHDSKLNWSSYWERVEAVAKLSKK